MARGILILGLNGCGKTTVGRLVSQRLGFFSMDAEDYYFPTPGDYSVQRKESEVFERMEADAEKHGCFVLSCVRCHLSPALLGSIRLAVVLKTDPQTRAERILRREQQRRHSPEAQRSFAAFAASRTEETVNSTLYRLACPIHELDATFSPDEIARQICLLAKQREL